MAAVLRGAGIRRAFLDVSGDCLAIGAPPGEPGWLVEIADPARVGRHERQRSAPRCGARHLGQHRLGGPLGTGGPGPRHESRPPASPAARPGPGHRARANRYRGRRAVHRDAGLPVALRRASCGPGHHPRLNAAKGHARRVPLRWFAIAPRLSARCPAPPSRSRRNRPHPTSSSSFPGRSPARGMPRAPARGPGFAASPASRPRSSPRTGR